ADDDVAAGKIEPAVEPFGEPERSRRRHRADRGTAVRVERRRGRAMEIGKAQLFGRRRQARLVLDRSFVDALARGVDASREVDDVADVKGSQILPGGREL